MFPPNQQAQIRTQLAGNLISVLSQALCPLITGRGRCAAYEFMVVTPAIANLIRENKVYRIDSSIQTGKKLGMQLLDEHLWELYDSGKISLEEMLDKGRSPGALQEKAMTKMAGARGKHKKKAAEAAQALDSMESVRGRDVPPVRFLDGSIMRLKQDGRSKDAVAATASAVPDSRPPPPTGATRTSSGPSALISSSAAVPWPAMTSG